MRHWTHLVVLVVLVMGCLFAVDSYSARAQGSEEEAARRILVALNTARIPENISPLAFNEALNRVALAHAYNLAIRPLDLLGNIYEANDGSQLSDWLQRDWDDHQADGTGFAPYSDGFFADIAVLVVRDVSPENLVRFWTTQAPVDQRVRSLFYDFRYREIGVAYVHDAATGRHYYVLVFGSRPNYLPVLITQQMSYDFGNTIIPVRDITLYILNEYSHPNGDEGAIGSVRDISVGENLDCLADQVWGPYINRYAYTVSAGFGQKTIYVDMRDALGRVIRMETTVLYTDDPNNPTPLTPPTVAVIANPPVSATPTATVTPNLDETLYAIQTDAAILTQAANAIATANQLTIEARATGTAAVLQTLTAQITVPPTTAGVVVQPAPPQTSSSTPTPTPFVISTPVVPTQPVTAQPGRRAELAWSDDFLVLSNPEDVLLDLNGLQFTSAAGHLFLGSQWRTDDDRVPRLDTRECAVVYNLDRDAPTLEEARSVGAYCRNIEVWRGVSSTQAFWSMSVQDGFTMTVNGVPAQVVVGECNSRTTTHCTVALP